MSEQVQEGYSKVKCHFCPGYDAGYGRREDNNPRGPFFDACEKCARKPYPQPAQLKKEE